jgi:hypothetical protein
MAVDKKEETQNTNLQNSSVPIEDVEEEEDLLYTYKQKNDSAQMRWNNILCRKPGK